MKPQAIFISCILLAAVCADILQNPDFELPPSTWNTTSAFFTLNSSSTNLPGWTFEGTVQYATAGDDLSLPENGHAMLLGQDGKINQTFTANNEGRMRYLLTFTLSRRALNCSANASLVIPAPDSSAEFTLSGKYGRELWEDYGHQIGSWGDGEAVNLVIESRADNEDESSTCWPVVDDLNLVTVGLVNQENGNLLLNGGSEVGPRFPKFPNNGILLNSEPSLTESALPQWIVTGTIKYIETKNYHVPLGNAAVQFVLGTSSDIQTAQELSRETNYNLEFSLGEANQSCSGDFTVGVVAGSSSQNFTIHSNGNGLAQKYSLDFQGAGAGPTPIGFESYSTGLGKDGVFCGPVIDGVVLRVSGECKLNGCLFVILLFWPLWRL
ncbi:Protein of unknown function- DUF642 [Striga hermonthica]|uniref:DUF642 domain-containing protein n=1 Tax=Striga hermonthica TaxID=68872 RepID=A0A9N7R3B2_STRHE|nr:Protein of unknown function- DUF642 [Striga hermonthica]